MSLLSKIRKQELSPLPWSERHPFADLHAAMDRLLGDFGIEREWGAPFGTTFPSVNVSENAEMVRVTAELPGMEMKDINVTLQGNRLVIAGEKTEEKEEEGRNWRRRERTSGSFERAFDLPPDVDPKKVDAKFKNGLLTVEMARIVDEKTRPKNIEVKNG